MRNALIAATAAAVAVAAAPAFAALNPHVVTAAGPVTVKPGEELLVALASNPTTGYSWAAAVSGAAVTAEGSAYRAPSGAALGAGGEQILAFEAVRAGTATITLSYRRPWEKGKKAARTVVVTVTVAK